MRLFFYIEYNLTRFSRLGQLLEVSRQAERLKVEKNSTASGRRYSTEYWNYVMSNRQKLSGLRYVTICCIEPYIYLNYDITPY